MRIFAFTPATKTPLSLSLTRLPNTDSSVKQLHTHTHTHTYTYSPIHRSFLYLFVLIQGEGCRRSVGEHDGAVAVVVRIDKKGASVHAHGTLEVSIAVQVVAVLVLLLGL